MPNYNQKKTKHLSTINHVLSFFFHEKENKSPISLNLGEEILVLAFDLIGDAVMLIPFLHVLKKNAPNARITLVCRPCTKAVLKEQGLVDRIITCKNRLFVRITISDFISHVHAIKEINRISYDYALEPRGDLRDILFMHFCNSERKIAYGYTGGEYMCTDYVQPSIEKMHLIDDKLFFLKQAGCKYDEVDRYPSLVLSEAQKKDNLEFVSRNRLGGIKLIGIHPGASWKTKQWAKFPDLLFELYNRNPSAFFLFFRAPDNEKSVVTDATINKAKECGANFIVVEEPIDKYIARIALCDVIICNDSGAGHIAAALDVETHVIFGPIDSEYAKPLCHKPGKVYTYAARNISCYPCGVPECKNNLECLDSIKVEDIIKNIRL